MRTFVYDNSHVTEICTKEKKEVPYIPKKKWKEYTEESKENYRITGQTKLKEAEEDDDKLIFPGEETEKSFIIKESYRFSRVKGYIPIGQNEYIKLMGFNPLWLLLLLLIALLVLLGIWWLNRPDEPQKPEINRYIEDTDMKERNNNTAATRYRFNTTMTIVKDTIQNMNFENINKDKKLQIKIKLHPDDGDYIYDSGLIPTGKVVKADTLLEHVSPGEYNTIAECFTYNLKEEKQGQTNFEVKLIVK